MNATHRLLTAVHPSVRPFVRTRLSSSLTATANVRQGQFDASSVSKASSALSANPQSSKRKIKRSLMSDSVPHRLPSIYYTSINRLTLLSTFGIPGRKSKQCRNVCQRQREQSNPHCILINWKREQSSSMLTAGSQCRVMDTPHRVR